MPHKKKRSKFLRLQNTAHEDAPRGGDGAWLDDTPKAFRRIMTPRRVEKTGNGQAKVKKVDETIKILPKEKMADFSRRVNEAIPVRAGRSFTPAKKSRKRKPQKSEDEQLEEADIEKRKRKHSPDPWSAVAARPVKFGEVAKAPPDLTIGRKMRQANQIPKSAGSMAKRMLLAAEREKVLKHLAERKEAQLLAPP